MEITAVDFLVCFIIFNLVLKVAYPISGLLHEVGHAVQGLLFAKGCRIQLRFGDCESRHPLKLGRLDLYIGPTTGFWGYCEFESNGLSTWRLIVIALGGPMVSLILTTAMLWILFDQEAPWEARLLAAVFFYANCHILIVAVLPRKFQPPASFKITGASDGLRILQLLKGKKPRN